MQRGEVTQSMLLSSTETPFLSPSGFNSRTSTTTTQRVDEEQQPLPIRTTTTTTDYWGGYPSNLYEYWRTQSNGLYNLWQNYRTYGGGEEDFLDNRSSSSSKSSSSRSRSSYLATNGTESESDQRGSNSSISSGISSISGSSGKRQLSPLARKMVIGSIGLLMVVVLAVGIASIVFIVHDNRNDPLRFTTDLERALYLQTVSPLVDGHNDVPWRLFELVHNNLSAINLNEHQPNMMTDIPRIREGKLGAQFWSVYVSCDYQGMAGVQQTMQQIDVVYRLATQYPDVFKLAFTADDVWAAFRRQKVASLIGMEGGHAINNSLSILRMFYRLGARYLTLTHKCNTDWADSSRGPFIHGGLTPFGQQVVKEMNRLGMLVDLSHVSPDVMRQAINISRAPVIFSHSAVYSLCKNERNVPDDVLDLLVANGGIVMLPFYPPFISATGNVTVKEVVDHVDYIVERIGVDHVGVGGDFDGITQVIGDLADVASYPRFTVELIKRGYSDQDIQKILGLNVLRVLKTAEQVAARLQKEELPSDMLCC